MMTRLLKNGYKSTFVILMVFALNTAAMAQFDQPPNDNLYDALKNQGVATTMTGNKLTSDWHIISSGELGIFAMFGAGSMMPQIAGFTQGKMVSFGNEKYLVAYYVVSKSDAQDIYSRDPRQSVKGYLFKDSTLSLALLPMNGNQSFYEVKKFDPAKDFLVKPLVRRDESISNLKQIALATFMYVQDYDETLPPMVAARSGNEIKNPFKGKVTNATPVQNRLMPYMKSKEIFLQPVTHRPYLPNYKVSRMADAKIKSPTTTFLFYEDAPDADGMRCVAYADGHVKALSEDAFQCERDAQGISESGYPSAAKSTKKGKAKPSTY